MEANYMIVGQSAGVAAALAMKARRQLHQVDVFSLQQILRSAKQVLSVNDIQPQHSGTEIGAIDRSLQAFGMY
jgi:hypothetical protein